VVASDRFEAGQKLLAQMKSLNHHSDAQLRKRLRKELQLGLQLKVGPFLLGRRSRRFFSGSP